MICAHITYGPYNYGHKAFANVAEATEFYTAEVAGQDYGTGVSGQLMDLYEAEDNCNCNDNMNFHDYPMMRVMTAVDGAAVPVAV